MEMERIDTRRHEDAKQREAEEIAKKLFLSLDNAFTPPHPETVNHPRQQNPVVKYQKRYSNAYKENTQTFPRESGPVAITVRMIYPGEVTDPSDVTVGVASHALISFPNDSIHFYLLDRDGNHRHGDFDRGDTGLRDGLASNEKFHLVSTLENPNISSPISLDEANALRDLVVHPFITLLHTTNTDAHPLSTDA